MYVDEKDPCILFPPEALMRNSERFAPWFCWPAVGGTEGRGPVIECFSLWERRGKSRSQKETGWGRVWGLGAWGDRDHCAARQLVRFFPLCCCFRRSNDIVFEDIRAGLISPWIAVLLPVQRLSSGIVALLPCLWEDSTHLATFLSQLKNTILSWMIFFVFSHILR